VTPNEEHDFYILRGLGDREWGTWIWSTLRSQGYSVLLDLWALSEADAQRSAEVEAIGAAKAVIAVVSQAALEEEAMHERLVEALRESTNLLAVYLEAGVHTPALTGVPSVVIEGLGEAEAATALIDAAAQVLPAPAPPRPRQRAWRRPKPARGDDGAPFPADLPRLEQPVIIEIRAGDILTTAADVAAFKYAERFEGVGTQAMEALVEKGWKERELTPRPGLYSFVESRGAVAAGSVLVVPTAGFSDFTYSDARRFSADVLRKLQIQRVPVRHVATTVHGPGYGLDEAAAFVSLVAGVVEALALGDAPASLERVSIVERSAERAEALANALQRRLSEVPYAKRLETAERGVWEFRLGVASEPGGAGAGRHEIELLESEPDLQPRVFAAYPFDLGDHFKFGIQQPAEAAALICEKTPDTVFTGDVVEHIKGQVRSAALVVALLTGGNPNVYLEVGYAWGCGIPTLLCIEKGEKPTFDLDGQKRIEYRNIEHLGDEMKRYFDQFRRDGLFDDPRGAPSS
jgi:TIR domain